MKKKVVVIGSGFASISAACYLAKEGYEVTVYEKNAQLGGRARQFVNQGFKFDMGPTWYWMPDVFERFFGDFGRKPSDYYQLERLGPAYRVYFDQADYLDISDDLDEIKQTFEDVEKNGAKALTGFLQKAEKNYDVAIKDLVYKPGISPFELVSKDTILEIPQFISTIHDVAKRKFKSPRLRQIIEFPVLFLGAKPSMTPAFYSFMNFADLSLGTWYPKGGMKSVVDGMIRLAEELGVSFNMNSNVSKITTDERHKVSSITINGVEVETDLLVSGADYAHTESLMLKENRVYSDAYWDKKVMAPSSLLFYVGLDKKIKNVLHHTLFFDVSFDDHAKAIYDDPAWPEKPLFYASFPSITDNTIAPDGKEAAIFLIPLAPDLEDTEELREKYFNIILERLEKLTQQEIKSSIIFKESYCVQDFKDDYNSFKGNAYGMANTLLQTAFLRPKLRSKKIKNLYFTGQLTVPGPGVPPSLISGKLVADLLKKDN
ncbi:phytoene desaturase family protein [Lutimonas halocynthiae]|uniref:phytoene desaturase family protein n=1 Tax=Lutimonas halocynthiae TaxID=1446477 RepID=UPI0025B35501|nr:phytoene desaturase family protein [Lutimonas halocynthiae]MDN3642354.1 phytoene desaturase family protein [Lutimonas halocynthiae]